MNKHHTKEKGDLGVLAVSLDLKKNDINICLPLSEHLPFDLIAVSDNGKLIRVSVKYRHYRPNTGAIDFTLRSCWSDKNGTHTVYHDKTEYDCLAFYCPDNQKCYYIKTSEVKGRSVFLRVLPTVRKIKNVLKAEEFENPKRMFL